MAAFGKDLYAAGLQCARRLWLEVHAPERAAAPDLATEDRLAMGAELGSAARALFPGGVLVSAAGFRAALARTRQLLGDPDVPAIFEAAFEHEGVRVRVDALERLAGGAFGIREVKAAGSARPEHFDDVALQLFVLRGCGLVIPSLQLVLVDTGYERGPGAVCWKRFFTRREVREDAELLLEDVPDTLAEQRARLGGDEPAVGPSPHCRVPRPCPFWSHCTAGKPDDWIYHLPGIRAPEFQALLERRAERIAEIPPDFPLKPRQARARDAHRSGRVVVADGLAEALAGAGPPAAYLDFEAMGPAVPRYAGMRPYRPIPFQWSLHRLDGAGVLSHTEFLARSAEDPRRAFAEALLAELADDEQPVHVYSSYEENLLADLAAAFPDLAESLDHLIARLVDLLPVVRGHVYAPAFGGSFSIKRVVPALVPGFSYGDLEGIADGGAAARAIGRLLAGGLAGSEEEALRAALRAYCERDTLALVELHRALRELAKRG